MSLTGTCKSFNGGKAYGFIQTAEGDVFVHQSDCGGAAPRVGDVLTFDVEAGSKPGQRVAKNVQGCTGVPEGAGGKGTTKGAVGTGVFTGQVKSFSELKAWGFIVHEGQDIFFHLKDIVDGRIPDRGDTLRYDIEENPGKPGTMKATNVTGGSKGMGEGKGFEKGKGGDKGKGKGFGGDSWGGDAWGPYGGGKGGGWGGDAWGKGDSWGGKGGKGDAWGKGGSWGGKGGW